MIVNTINNTAPLGGNRGVIATAESLLQNNERFALVVVVSTQGSTYRKPGALALVAENGTTRSVISGGCLEPMLQDAAQLAIRDHAPSTLLLDTSTDDDLIFGSGSGCRGKMRILIIPVAPPDAHPLYQTIAHMYLHNQHQSYKRLKCALAISKPYCGQGTSWSDEQQWNFGGLSEETGILRDAPLGEHTVRLQDGVSVDFAVFNMTPPRRLLIIGAGVEAPCLIHLARSMGWHTTVIDHRERQIALHATDADVTFCSRPELISGELQNSSFDAALIMSHSVSVDLEALQMMASRTEPYVGLLGPPARRDELLMQLTDQQREHLSTRLHAPLGLRLGGDGPESLALSIAAELQGFFHHD